MRRYVIALLLVSVSVMVSAQERVVPIPKTVSNVNSDAEKVRWSEIVVDKDISRLSFNVIRNKTEAPLRGEVHTYGRGCIVKGKNSIPDVVSFAKGIVIASAADSVVVNHSNGLESTYKNILSRKVRVGDHIKKGQLIGRLPQYDKNLFWELKLHGTTLDLMEIIDPKTALVTYSGNLYIYNIDQSIFASRFSPMVLSLPNSEYYDGMFESYYDSFISQHRQEKDFDDVVVSGALEDEISLEDVQVEPAKEQEAIRVKNEIEL